MYTEKKYGVLFCYVSALFCYFVGSVGTIIELRFIFSFWIVGCLIEV